MAQARRRARTSSPERRWRPNDRRGPVCKFTWRDKTCRKKGAHYCAPRADKAAEFFPGALVHTKGQWARKPFDLEPWQEDEIIRPIFGEVLWSDEWDCYVRRYVVAGICVARKNGKSEIAAGCALQLLCADDEESSEVYGAAKDTKQAGKVWEPAKRMRELSPLLRNRLSVNINSRRIIHESSASYYEVITADALGELGHNPHGFVLDEVLSQPDGSLWESMRTAAGTRHQPLFLVITTETNEPDSFGAEMIDELERIEQDPKRNPRWFAFVRKTPSDADPWDERNWHHANPALGSFLSIESLRQEALEAKNDPTKENAFRQYRLNQRVQQATRWITLRLWDKNAGTPIDEEKLAGRRCFGGLDLAASTDLASLAWWFPGEPNDVIWRFWAPEAKADFFDKHTGGQFSLWVRQGLVTLTEGDWIDFRDIRKQLDKDLTAFSCVELGYDPWGAPDTVQWMQRRGMTVYPVPQTYAGLSMPMQELMRLLKASSVHHGGNPVARWMADSVEVKHPTDQPDVIKPVKPKRDATGKRIDGITSLVNAIAAATREHEEPPPPATGSGKAPASPGANPFRSTGRLKI